MNSEINKILSISPVDGRYKSKTQPLLEYFSEFALIKHRVYVEIEYFLEFTTLPIKNIDSISLQTKEKIKKIYQDFSESDALRIKEIEKEINHDVKAVEYFIKEEFEKLNLENFKEFIHFGLTSQDINNTAIPLMIKNSISEIIISMYEELNNKLSALSKKSKNVPMVARTHGQVATPTTFGKEIQVFEERIKKIAVEKSVPGYLHTCIGSEAICVGVMSALDSDDWISSTYRNHGHSIAKNCELKEITSEIYGRRTGICKGRGGSMHISDFDKGMLGSFGIVAAGPPVVLGAALQEKINGGTKMSATFIGDGAIHNGAFHEAAGLAKLWDVPMLFV